METLPIGLHLFLNQMGFTETGDEDLELPGPEPYIAWKPTHKYEEPPF
jgi:hypothetical protein